MHTYPTQFDNLHHTHSFSVKQSQTSQLADDLHHIVAQRRAAATSADAAHAQAASSAGVIDIHIHMYK